MSAPFRTSDIICGTEYTMKAQPLLFKIHEEFHGGDCRVLNQRQSPPKRDCTGCRPHDAQTLLGPTQKRKECIPRMLVKREVRIIISPHGGATQHKGGSSTCHHKSQTHEAVAGEKGKKFYSDAV